jgi:pyrroloquinoline-quinone synthase
MSEATAAFFTSLDTRLDRYDLLKHAYYQAWSAGELTREDLREYAAEYWHHVAAFPAYLSALHSRLPEGRLRRMVAGNLADEEGLAHGDVAHSEMWMDFARGMGAEEAEVRGRELGAETRALIEHFREAMTGEANGSATGSATAALAALYAYESRVPAIAQTKAEGLARHYTAEDKDPKTDEATRRYFAVHTTADVHHARVWREAIEAELAAHPEETEAALAAGEAAARRLWETLDGVERGRQARLAAAA